MLISLVCIVLALRLRPFLSFTPLTIVHEMCIKRATLYNRRGIVDRTHFIDASLLAMFAKYSTGFYLNYSNLSRILEECKLRLFTLDRELAKSPYILNVLIETNFKTWA